MTGGMFGLMVTALLSVNRQADMQRQIGELIEENVHLKSRGRKPKPKRKPTRRRNA
jgi:hypothetical protein|tara:strand:- start:2936 stop:3103 length:168 start_codon:yes stop_codon:yes gene_type:complete